MLEKYLKEIANTTIQGDAREESYYPHLSNLVKEYSKIIGRDKTHITILPKKTEAGNPDFRIWDGQQNIVGYIEAKVPGSDLNRIEDSEQLKRYRDTFPNVILTDFYEFRLYRNSKLIEKTFIGRPFVASKLKTKPPVENLSEFNKLFDLFFGFSLPKVYSAETLAIELAKRTRFLKDEVIHQELDDEENQTNQVIGFYEAFQKYLIAGLTKEEFADLYAQTIAYGLFAARTRTEDNFNRRLAYSFIPPTIGILRDVFQFISLGSLSLQMEVIIDDLSEVLNVADINKILIDYKKTGKGEDPIFHFYETFLHKYDPATREKRGVYYTPEPVVNFIVRSVNQILIDDFGKENGFANRDVTVLDPAAGTLTFLAQTTKFAIKDFSEKYGEGHISSFIKEHILKNFYAFELMMAPYAIAHLKMSYLLDEYGYKMTDKDRFKLYLTNTLEVEDLQQTRIPGMASLADESKQATIVKKKQQILAIMGNPPYSVASYNKSDFIEDIMDLYKKDVKDEKNIQLLSDDYAKFIRFCHWKIEQAGIGVIGLITKNTYLNTTAFRGLRQKLLEFFDKIFVFNLHGKLYEKVPEGNKDQNVFDIRVGTAILLLIKTGRKKKSALGKLFYKELFGDRISKYHFLDNNQIHNIDWEKLHIDKNYYFFEKKNFTNPDLYNSFYSIYDIFNKSNTGVETRRDSICLKESLEEIKSVIRNFINLDIKTLNNAYQTGDTRDWKTKQAKEDIIKNKNNDLFHKYSHKPFQNKFTFYTGKSKGFMGTPANDLMKNFIIGSNICLILKKRHTDTIYSHCFCSDKIVDRNFLGGQSYIFPLWLYSNGEIFEEKQSNLKPEFEKMLEKQYKQKNLTEQIFYYIYAILYCKKYRESFAELLQIDYPKIPFTTDFKLFKNVSDIGKRLVDLHLLTSNELSKPRIKFNGKGNNKVTDIIFRDNNLYINTTQYFSGVNKGIWEWEVGNNKPVQRHIKNYKDRELGLDGAIEFCKICTSIELTFECQNEIEDLYEKIIETLI